MNLKNFVSTAFLVTLLTVVLFVGVWQIKPAQAVTVFDNGFEDGNGFTSWTSQTANSGDAIAISASASYTGINGSRSTITSSYGYAYTRKDFGDYTTLYARAYIRFGTALPSDSTHYRPLELRTGNNGAINLAIYYASPNYHWRIYEDMGYTYVESSPTTLNLGQWYCIELKGVVNDALNGEAKLYVDGVEVASMTGKDFSGISHLNSLRIGENYHTGNVDHIIDVDNVVVATTYIGIIPVVGPPIFGTISTNTTLAGNGTQLSCLISDNTALSSWGFAWNNTGATVNASKIIVSGSSLTVLYNGTWNETTGNKVWVQFWANDSDTNEAYSSVQTFTMAFSSLYLTEGDGEASDWNYRISDNTTSSYVINNAGTVIYNNADPVVAINQAIIYADVAGSQSIYVYPDTYLTTTALGKNPLYNYQYSNIYLMLGAGTIIKRTGGSGAADYMFTLHNYGIGKQSTNFTLTSNGTAYFKAENYASGFEIFNTYTFTMTNVEFDNLYGLGGGLTKCRYPHLENVTIYDACKSYASFLFGMEQIQYGTFKNLDFDAVSKTACLEGFYIGEGDWRDFANGWNGTYFNTFTNVSVSNMRRNGFYLNGQDSVVGSQSVSNNTFSNCTLEGNAQDGYFGIKLRPAQNNTFTNIIIRNMTGGVTTGTAYNTTGQPEDAGNCTGNYVQAIMSDISSQPFSITTDGDNQEVANNVFNLTYSDGPRTYFASYTNSTIYNNIVYMNFTDTNGGIYLESGHFYDNIFYLNFSRSGGGGYEDITHYAAGWENMTDNVFNVYMTSGNPNGLMDFTNGTQGNVVVYPYVSGSVGVVVASPTNTTYSSPTILVELYASGGTIDKIWWNIKSGASWVYVSNQTYTMPTTTTTLTDGSYTFYAWANNTLGTKAEETVMLTIVASATSVEWGGYWGRWWGYP